MRLKAFTLVEVLVALVIIAIACTAVVKAMSDGILVSSHLRQELVSRWVASNVLSQLQNGLLPSLRDNPDQSGKVTMMGRQWGWRAQAPADLSNSYYQQVNIFVGSVDGQKQYYRLDGFVWQPQTQRA